MNKVQIFQLILKILIPIIAILIARYIANELNPVKKSDNIIKMMAYIVIIGFLAFIELSLLIV